jgi:hypothetical protein
MPDDNKRNLLVRPESNNCVTVFCGEMEFRLIRVDDQLLISVPEDYVARQAEAGDIVFLLPVGEAEKAITSAAGVLIETEEIRGTPEVEWTIESWPPRKES